MMQELPIVYEHERFRFENPTGDVIVGEAKDADGNLVFIKGPVFGEDPRPGVSYVLYGRWTTYYNRRLVEEQRQFAYQSLVVTKPISTHAKAIYLQQIKGIGPATAGRIVEWCDGNLDALRTNPEAAADEVRGLSLEAAQLAAKWLDENLAMETAQIALLELFHRRGFPKSTPNKVLETFGNRGAELIKANPYLLMRFKGCGFKLSDKLYGSLGLPPERTKRQCYCLMNAVNRDTSGDTWYRPDRLRYELEGSIGGCEPRYERVVRILHRSGRFVSRFEGDVLDGTQWVTDARLADHEDRIAGSLQSLLLETCHWPESIDGLSDHQQETLQKVFRAPVAILGGGPGTGKTFTAARIIQWAVRQWGKASIAVCAPTGKAAVRITEAMQEHGLQLTARTIHSTLEVKSADDGWEFEHDECNPLPYRLIVVDESSMIPNDLMGSLLAACSPRTHVLFVGDVNQLPPVGRGAPLRDMIAAGVAYGELDEVRRNAGAIVAACREIRHGRRFSFCEQPSMTTADNLINIRVRESSEVHVQEGIHEALDWAAQHGYRTVWDCQVLVPLNDKGPAARKALNAWIQQLLNPNPETKYRFRLNDKVICTKNQFLQPLQILDKYDAESEGIIVNQFGSVLVANGDMGRVVHIDEEREIIVVELQAPERTVKIRCRNFSSGDEEEDAGDTGVRNWDLAYAISVHKSQGSEFPVGIVVADPSGAATRLCNREWWYTALSRAKHWCICVGDPDVIYSGIRNTGIHERKTFLTEAIREQCGDLLASPSFALS